METFNFKKKFGQNFLKDVRIVQRIADVASITKNDLVIEVGPGSGILTKQLVIRAKNVLAYEIDNDLEEQLNTLKSENNNLDIIFDDFINRNINNDIEKYSYEKIYFVSNVPYYITTPILMKLMDSNIDFEKIVMMVQKEVGERFCSKPNSKQYGSITVYLNYFYNLKKEFLVNRCEFIPVPNVDSVVISLTKKENLLYLKNKELFFKLVRDSFKFKRKTIKNNLSDYNLEVIEKKLLDNGYSLTSRAEQLPLEIYVEMANSL